MRINLLALITFLALSICAAQAELVPAAPRISDIRATVLGVEKLDFPAARVRLRVTESTEPGVLDVKVKAREITAENHLRRINGKVNFQDKRNIDAVAAYYLLQGDEIRGKLLSGSSAPGREGPWLVYGIERISPDSPPGPVRKTNVQGNLRLTVEVGQPTYKSGEPVPMSFTVENTGLQSETLMFSSGQHYDFAVMTNGREIWRWSADKAFIQMLTSFTLAPGEKKTFTAAWPQKDNQGVQVKPGEYAVEAFLTASGAPKMTVGPVVVTVKAKE